MTNSDSPKEPPLQVGLFVTCLVDMFRPLVGFAAVELLEKNGCVVSVPTDQPCCGQPAYNSGDTKTAKAIAKGIIESFEAYDYIVAPSGSCTGMVSHHYPTLFEGDPDWELRARDLARRTYELVAFLSDVLKVESTGTAFDGTVTYHDSCSGLRELKIKQQPRKLLNNIKGLSLSEMEQPEICCGFGGTFCVKYPDISNKMVGDKTADICATGADTVLAGDLGCLMNMAGKLQRDGKPVRVRHVAEVLAGMADGPAIGEREG